MTCAQCICLECGGCGNVPGAKRLSDYPCAPVTCSACGGSGLRGEGDCPWCAGKSRGQDA